MASLALRSPWTAMSMRDRPAHSVSCAGGLCGALWGRGWTPSGDRRRWFVGDDRMDGDGADDRCRATLMPA